MIHEKLIICSFYRDETSTTWRLLSSDLKQAFFPHFREWNIVFDSEEIARQFDNRPTPDPKMTYHLAQNILFRAALRALERLATVPSDAVLAENNEKNQTTSGTSSAATTSVAASNNHSPASSQNVVPLSTESGKILAERVGSWGTN